MATSKTLSSVVVALLVALGALSQTLAQPGGNPMGFPGGNPVGFPGGNPMGLPGGNTVGFPGGNPVGFPGGNPMGFPGGNPVGFPGGNPRGFPGMFNMYNDFILMQQLRQLQIQQDPTVLTCISPTNPTDPTTTLRLTIKEETPTGFSPNSITAPRSWMISGLYQPSTAAPASGVFQVVVTQYGRTQDGCNPNAMGPAITATSTTNNPGFPSNSPLSFLQMALNLARGQNLRPAGQLDTPLQVPLGGMTIYNGYLRDVSEAQLRGAGIIVCTTTDTRGQCLGVPLTCCSIVRDQKEASSTYPPPQAVTAGTFGGSSLFPTTGVGSGTPFNPTTSTGVLGGGL